MGYALTQFENTTSQVAITVCWFAVSLSGNVNILKTDINIL